MREILLLVKASYTMRYKLAFGWVEVLANPPWSFIGLHEVSVVAAPKAVYLAFKFLFALFATIEGSG